MVLKTDILKCFIDRIPKRNKICFSSGMILGWITHFYMLTHKLPNWDDISQIDSLGLTTQIGRWMLEPLRDIGQRASNPAVHGMLLICFISIAACMVVSALDLETVTSAVLVPAIMVTFPSVTGVLFFMFTAHLYALGILLFCTAAYLIRRFKLGFIPAGICIILALAIYQPFVSIIIALFLIMLIRDVFRGKNFVKLLGTGFAYAVTLTVSTLLYMMIAHIIYPRMSSETYGGANEMGKMTLADTPRNFARVYKRVLEYFFTRPFAFVTPGMRVANVCICVLIVGLVVLCIYKYGLIKRLSALAFAIGMFFLFPFAIGFVYFMAPKAPFSMLMLYAYSMMYVLLLALVEILWLDNNDGICEKKSRIEPIVQHILTATSVVVLILCAYMNYLLDSQAYFRSSIAFARASNFYNRIIMLVEEQDEFKNGDRVAILGEFYYKNNPAPIEIPIFQDDEGFRELSGVALENGLITSGVRNDFIRTYLGFDCGYISEDEREEILNSDDYISASMYPDNNCVTKYKDIWVVKLCP